MIYFTSDLHFYHEKIIKHTNRHFTNTESMNKGLIKNWNKTVSKTDEVYILGDVTMKGSNYANTVLSCLNGKKYLIKGNHDNFLGQASFNKSIFQWVKDYYELEYKNEKFILCHYPIEVWNGCHKGTIHLHGHLHSKEEYNYENLNKGLKRFDVGVDANNMYPISIEDIITFFN